MQPNDAIQTILKRVRREVWIVTAADGTRRGGLLASWVHPASIDPTRPLIVAAIAQNHFTHELISASRALAVHQLSEDQVELALRFALGSGRDHDKFAGLACEIQRTGSPIVTQAPAWLDCRVIDAVPVAERTYFLAEPLVASPPADFIPLSDHDLLRRASPEQRTALLADMTADQAIQGPVIDRWKSSALRPAD